MSYVYPYNYNPCCNTTCQPRRKCCKKQKKRCCKRRCCQSYQQCVQTKCGFISFMLSVVASETSVVTGTPVNYSVTVINTGSDPIFQPITIQTNILGSTTIFPGYLAPGASFTSTNLFTNTPTTTGTVSLVTTGFTQLDCDVILTSQPVTTNVTVTAPEPPENPTTII